MKKLMMLLLLALPAMATAQVIVVNVVSLSEEDSNDRVGVVLQKDADNETFYNLTLELSNHSNKVGAAKVQASRMKGESESDIMNEAFSKMEELKKMGLVSEADIQKLKAEMNAQLKTDAEHQARIAEMAAGPGSSNPSVLKEKIRSYCIGKRFFYSALNAVDGMVRVESRTADGKRRMGYIDATIGRVVIEPDRYAVFNNGTTMGFTKDGYITGHTGTDAVMLDKTGRIVLEGYRNLYFYNDCKMLKAVNYDGKVGIIDYQGNVLEPFIHDSPKSESLAQAANRIFNASGGVKAEIW